MTTTRKGPALPVKLDWLNVTLPADAVEGVRLLLTPFLGPAEHRDKGMGMFPDGCYRWACGAVLAWRHSDHLGWLSVNGDSLDLLGADSWRSWVCDLVELGGKLTRIDVAADVHDRSLVTLDQVHAAAEAGDFTGPRRTNAVTPKRRRAGKLELEGDMRTFGTRGKDGGGRYVRVYDKALETGGKVDAVRFEVEHSGELAAMVGRALRTCPTDEAFRQELAALVAGSIDFRHRGNHRHVDRMPRCDWWARLVELLGKEIRLCVVQPPRPLASMLEWFARNVAPSLALARMVANSQGWSWGHFMAELLDAGERRIRWGSGAGKLHLGYDRDAVLSAARC